MIHYTPVVVDSDLCWWILQGTQGDLFYYWFDCNALRLQFEKFCYEFSWSDSVRTRRGLRKISWKVNNADEQKTILTSVPLYIKPAVGFRSFECCNWSESLSWHIISFFSRGTMLIDVHLSSIVHQFLQWLYICIPTGNEMFLMTWPISAYPCIGSRNLRRRQTSVS